MPFIQERAPQVDFNATRIYEELKEQVYNESYSSVKVAVRPLRTELINSELATMRFETPPGRQAQIDWGSTMVMINGQPRRLLSCGAIPAVLSSIPSSRIFPGISDIKSVFVSPVGPEQKVKSRLE